LPTDHFPAGTTDSGTFLDARLKVEYGFDIHFELGIQLLKILKRKVPNLHSFLLRERNGATGDVMSLPKRYLTHIVVSKVGGSIAATHPFPNQVVCKIRRKHIHG
jgi:hypothetical protein